MNDLYPVSTACRECATKWEKIGLCLGLPKHLLDEIEKRNREDSVQCLDEMLSCWLKQTELISGYPLPSWRVLCNAIHEAGENPALAGRIASGVIAKQSKLYILGNDI